jgi:hypothetical protein
MGPHMGRYGRTAAAINRHEGRVNMLETRNLLL